MDQLEQFAKASNEAPPAARLLALLALTREYVLEAPEPQAEPRSVELVSLFKSVVGNLPLPVRNHIVFSELAERMQLLAVKTTEYMYRHSRQAGIQQNGADSEAEVRPQDAEEFNRSRRLLEEVMENHSSSAADTGRLLCTTLLMAILGAEDKRINPAMPLGKIAAGFSDMLGEEQKGEA